MVLFLFVLRSLYRLGKIPYAVNSQSNRTSSIWFSQIFSNHFKKLHGKSFVSCLKLLPFYQLHDEYFNISMWFVGNLMSFQCLFLWKNHNNNDKEIQVLFAFFDIWLTRVQNCDVGNSVYGKRIHTNRYFIIIFHKHLQS